MDLFKAITNAILRMGSNYLYERDMKNARSVSYKKTGKAINQAKNKKTWINASATYKNQYAAELRKAEQNKKLRDQFISDL